MSTSINESMIQKRIQKQVSQQASLYTMNFAALNSTINNQNEGIKFDSYQRYLNKKKGRVLKDNGTNVASDPTEGNKKSSIAFSSKVSSNCSC